MSERDGVANLPTPLGMTAPLRIVFRESSSPPKAQVDEASLQQAMDKNKESLKLKLMSRRPIHQLVEQGIIPSLKVPPHYYEQCQKLERAKRTDFLKNKIQKRPDRQALIQQHILEDTTIDPSLQDKQRRLKKARLADDLNDRLSHRPGPLELVKGNILHTDERFAQAIKEGQIPFKKTCEGQALRHPLPCFKFEDDSGSDVALSPPQDILDQSFGSLPSTEGTVLSPYPNHDSPSSGMGELRITTTTPPAPLASPTSSHPVISHTTESAPKESSTISRKKKSKSKPQPKTRTIKFHEYKGPPSAQKNVSLSPNAETSYELLLQQQQLFLQCQLEMQQKYPQVILPSPPQPQPSGDQSKQMNCLASSPTEKSQDGSNVSLQNQILNFEDLKVQNLKAELKRRNLPVSGSKVKLIERLMQHLESSNLNKIPEIQQTVPAVETTAVPINLSGIILDTLPTIVAQPEPAVASVVTVEASRAVQDATVMVYNTVPVHGPIMTSRPSSTSSMDVDMSSDGMDCYENSNDDIVKRQQQKIFQLEKELQRSQRQLQQQQWWQQQQQVQQQAQQQVLLATHPVPIAPAPPMQPTRVAVTHNLPQPTTVGQAVENLQQLFQLKNQSQQIIQQAAKFPPGSAEHSAFVKSSLAAFLHAQKANNVRLQNGTTVVGQQNIAPFANLKPIVLCQASAVPAIIDKPRANSLPNGVGQQKIVWSSVPNFSNIIAPKMTVNVAEPKFIIQKAPVDYAEAVRPQLKIKPVQEKQSNSRKSGKKSVKSQEVEDVLDVLIKNGELPPSAADTPTTPETAKGTKAPPVFPIITDVRTLLSSCPMDHNLNLKPHESVSNDMVAPPPVFDLHLELQDLESMDLGVLDRTDLQSKNELNQPLNSNSYSDLDMDVEFSDWLDVLTNNSETSNGNIVQNGFQTPRNCSDPLLSSMDSNQETLDMFALENLDFKTPADLGLMSWDKIDYAT